MAKAKGPEAETVTRLEAALRGWRLVEARRRGVPAFRIFSDRTLRALATSHPVTIQELLVVPGIGTSTVAKYGTKICRVLRENGG
jgi:superfamily II DNA helicase RecQ